MKKQKQESEPPTAASDEAKEISATPIKLTPEESRPICRRMGQSEMMLSRQDLANLIDVDINWVRERELTRRIKGDGKGMHGNTTFSWRRIQRAMQVMISEGYLGPYSMVKPHARIDSEKIEEEVRLNLLPQISSSTIPPQSQE